MISPDEGQALDFCLRLARTHAAVVRRLDTTLGSHFGLSFSDFMLLNHLANAPGGRLRRVDLAEKQGLTASGVTRSLLPLEKIGVIARRADERDARVSYALLTPAGHDMLDNALPVARETCKELVRNTKQEELAALSTVLGNLA